MKTTFAGVTAFIGSVLFANDATGQASVPDTLTTASEKTVRVDTAAQKKTFLERGMYQGSMGNFGGSIGGVFPLKTSKEKLNLYVSGGPQWGQGALSFGLVAEAGVQSDPKPLGRSFYAMYGAGVQFNTEGPIAGQAFVGVERHFDKATKFIGLDKNTNETVYGFARAKKFIVKNAGEQSGVAWPNRIELGFGVRYHGKKPKKASPY